MADRDTVIKGLKACQWTNQTRQYCKEQGCPYIKGHNDGFCVERLHVDALELLNEPRVMTLEEVWGYGDDKPLFVEYVLPTKTVLKPAIFQPDNSDEGDGDGYMCIVSAWRASGFYNRKEYGKTWRCWTTCPTDGQRKAIPWL